MEASPAALRRVDLRLVDVGQVLQLGRGLDEALHLAGAVHGPLGHPTGP